MIEFLFTLNKLLSKIERLEKKYPQKKTTYGILWLLVLSLFLFYAGFLRSLAYLTRYFPFSLLFQDNLSHYKNRYTQKFAEIIRTTVRGFGGRFDVEIGDEDNYFISVTGKFISYRHKKITVDRVVKKIEEEFSFTKGNVYFREEKNGKSSLWIPRSLIEERTD